MTQRILTWLDSPVFKTAKQAKIFLAIFQLAVILLFLSIVAAIIVKFINLFG